MSMRRFCELSILLGLAALVGLDGCAIAQRSVAPCQLEDDFGLPTDDRTITPDSVQQEEMFQQRVQLELKAGPSFPFDIFNPGNDTRTDIGPTLGAKGSFEVDKNLFLGLSFDWARHNVENAVGEQIGVIALYDKFNFLVNADYDIPLWQGSDAMFLRVGAGVGMVVIGPRDAGRTQNVETVLQFVFRPTIGIRYPLSEKILIFSELSYDFVPERSLTVKQFGDDVRVGGERAAFDSGAIWFGVAFQWY
jgi:hypothetical protein